MVEYFYAWTPLLIIGTVLLVSLPWLGPVVLLVGALAVLLAVLLALAALLWAIVVLPYRLGRAIGRRWQGRGGVRPRTPAAVTAASPRTAAALSPARRDNR